jgi:hypothetical protein
MEHIHQSGRFSRGERLSIAAAILFVLVFAVGGYGMGLKVGDTFWPEFLGFVGLALLLIVLRLAESRHGFRQTKSELPIGVALAFGGSGGIWLWGETAALPEWVRVTFVLVLLCIALVSGLFLSMAIGFRRSA